MKKKDVRIEDAGAGTIDAAATEFPTRQQWEARIRKYREAVQGKRLWPAGSVSQCPKCKKRALVGADDLVHRVVRPGNVQTFRHLRGGKCSACDAQFLEPEETIAVEDVVGTGVVADFEAKVSNIGSGTLGTYWPKDVVRVMELEAGRGAFIQVIDKDTALVRFAGTKESAKLRRKPKRPARGRRATHAKE